VTLRARLEEEVRTTLYSQSEAAAGTVIPTADRLLLNANHAISLASATVLYADIDGSTSMVDRYTWWFSAEVYKAYLRCAAQIIRDSGGTITAYDGDRVMAIFIGDSKNTSAAAAALKINSAVLDIIRPAIAARYPGTEFQLNHVIGIDTSPLQAARIGIHGDNDIVWIGKAANHAAKLASLVGSAIWITSDVYNALADSLKFVQQDSIWERFSWNNAYIYRSAWKQTFV